MKKDFDKTPSFFNDEETFGKFLGNTSYYSGLQNGVKRLISLAGPESVLELGSATGATTIMLARTFADIRFTGADMRREVVRLAQAEATALENVSFFTADMSELVKSAVDADFVVMLYSFHHLPDPLEIKAEFLKNAHENMKRGAYLCIAETFIPDAAGPEATRAIQELWEKRRTEGYASTFWNCLNGLEDAEIEKARAIAKYCGDNEYFAGELVAKRCDEYLVCPKWLTDTAEAVGFKVVVNEGINAIGDRIVLLQK